MSKAPTRRALAKKQTREKVLAAARSLFSEQGYERATIRDIAARAGMSTGAVFANFSDKSDLFREILFADVERQLEAAKAAAAAQQPVEARLLSVFMSGYRYYGDQLPLVRAAFGVAWTVGEGRALPVLRQREVIDQVMREAADQGELRKDADQALRCEMLLDAFISNFPRAIFDNASLDALEARARGQISIVLAGARPA